MSERTWYIINPIILISLPCETVEDRALLLLPKTSLLPYSFPCCRTWPAFSGPSSFPAFSHSRLPVLSQSYLSSQVLLSQALQQYY